MTSPVFINCADSAISGQTLTIPNRTQHYLIGEVARIECQVETGFHLDTPFNSWTKDSANVVEDDRISVTVSSTRSVLVIRNVQSSDAGEYACSKEGFPARVTETVTVETRPGTSPNKV